MINTGNLRRENTQAYLIPLLQQAGFNVVPDNGTAEDVFQQRLPSLDYDLGMYINTVQPDPQYLTTRYTCAQIPSEENDFQGQNSTGWCNEEASAALEEADVDGRRGRPRRADPHGARPHGRGLGHAAAGAVPAVGRLADEKFARSGRPGPGNYQAFHNFNGGRTSTATARS